MATFALIHGGGDVGWYWHLVEAVLRERGHDVVAPDLPCDDDTATLVADRLPVDALVYVAAMVPAPGERPADWWENTGYPQAVEEQARRDGGLTGSDDPFVAYYHGLPRALAEEAISRERSESNAAYTTRLPLASLPAVPTRCVVCTDDRFLPAPFLRRVVAGRLGVVPDEIDAGHCVALSRPHELGLLLDGYSKSLAS